MEQKETCLVLLVYNIHAKINFKKIWNNSKVQYIKRSSIILPLMYCLYMCNELSHSAQHTVASHGDIKHIQLTSEQLELATFLLTAVLTCCTIHKSRLHLVKLHLSKFGQHAAERKCFIFQA